MQDSIIALFYLGKYSGLCFYVTDLHLDMKTMSYWIIDITKCTAIHSVTCNSNQVNDKYNFMISVIIPAIILWKFPHVPNFGTTFFPISALSRVHDIWHSSEESHGLLICSSHQPWKQTPSWGRKMYICDRSNPATHHFPWSLVISVMERSIYVWHSPYKEM